MDKNKRGTNLSAGSLRALIARSAGVCQFKGCGQRLTVENLLATSFYKAHVAHIVASSPNGPRGDAIRSHQFSADINNCMLLCPEHNKIVDELTTEYSEEGLLIMKREHELLIDKMCDVLIRPSSTIITFTSPIRGNRSVVLDHQDIKESILVTHQPFHPHNISLQVGTTQNYGSSGYWDTVEKDLENNFFIKIQPIIDDPSCRHMSVFAMAPIPLIIKLGYMLGDKIPCATYQKFREPDTWKWQKNTRTNDFKVERLENDQKVKQVAIAIVFSISDTLSIEIPKLHGANVVFEIKASINDVYAISSKEDLKAFWLTYQSVLNDILESYPVREKIMIFPCIPNSAAFEIGRRTMDIHGEIEIYDRLGEGYEKTITIGENK